MTWGLSNHWQELTLNKRMSLLPLKSVQRFAKEVTVSMIYGFNTEYIKVSVSTVTEVSLDSKILSDLTFPWKCTAGHTNMYKKC